MRQQTAAAVINALHKASPFRPFGSADGLNDAEKLMYLLNYSASKGQFTCIPVGEIHIVSLSSTRAERAVMLTYWDHFYSGKYLL